MSLEQHQLNTILDFQADLDWAISEGDWKKGAYIVFEVFDLGYEHEAKMMNNSLKRAQAEFLEQEPVWTPVENAEIPFITPAEDDAPVSPRKESEYATEWGEDGRLHTFKV